MSLGTPPEHNAGALTGYRVLSMCNALGVFCPKILADLGADVIIIEPPEGASTRRRTPFYHDQADAEKSLYFWYFHTNTRSITLNLDTADGQELLRTLIPTADIFVETTASGYLASLHLDYPHLQALHPGLIMTSITGFGRTGPYSHYKAPDIVGLAMGGLAFLCGEPDAAPVPPGGEQGYRLAALNAAMATLMALWHREQTGAGQHIDVSMQAAVANTLETTHQTFDFNREIRGRQGRKRQAAAYILACRDGFIAVLSTSRMGWPRLVEWLQDEGCGDAIADERLTDDYFRAEHEDLVHTTLQAFFAPKTKQEIYTEAQRRRLPLAPVHTAADLAASPQLQARGFFVDVPHPDLDATVTYPGAPYALSETPWHLRRQPPHLGEHNEDIYVHELGLSHDDLAALKAGGVL